MDIEKPFRVLSLDGGGMRGLYTAVILQRLTQLFDSKYQTRKDDGKLLVPDIGKAFDLICGTSTGAILACSLAKGIPIEKIIKLYTEKGNLIFPDPMPNSLWDKLRWGFRYRNAPAALPEELKKVLDDFFKVETIKSSYDNRRIGLCIPTINASNHKAWVFKTPHFSDKHRDDNYLLRDVCMASAAAPIFFPMAKIKNPDISEDQFFVDGGLWANNPILVGLIEALALTQDAKDRPVELISIGTCELPTADPNNLKTEAGILDWQAGIGITDMAISSQAYGYSSMATFIGSILSSLGKPVTIVRLEESMKSPSQLSAIGLDKANDVAIQTLVKLVSADADLNHSNALNNKNSKEYNLIRDVFSNMIELTD